MSQSNTVSTEWLHSTEKPVIEEIGKLQYAKIIEYGKPLGKYYLELEPGTFLGVHNMTGIPSIRAFSDVESTVQWLNEGFVDLRGEAKC